MDTPLYELAVERHIAATPAVVWDIWAGRLAQWWCPQPWTTVVRALELHAGGRFALVMSGPNGEREEIEGVILEAVPAERIVFTNAFTAGWRPQAPFMVGVFTFTAEGQGTRYRAASRHWDEETHRRHQQMGFDAGWTAVAAQLAALAERRD